MNEYLERVKPLITVAIGATHISIDDGKPSPYDCECAVLKTAYNNAPAADDLNLYVLRVKGVESVKNEFGGDLKFTLQDILEAVPKEKGTWKIYGSDVSFYRLEKMIPY